MKRLNIKDAFLGEPSGSDDDLEGDEAVVVAVRGGEIVVVASPGKADSQVLDQPTLISGSLRMENERILTFEIYGDATGAFVEDESGDLHRRRQQSGSVGLSSIEGHDYMDVHQRRARDLMTSSVVFTSPATSVKELTRLLGFHNVSGLPVMDGANVVGVVSEADVIAKSGRTVGDIMTREVVSAVEDDTLESVAHLMADRQVKRVLIMRGEQLVGLVSRADIVKALAGV